MRSNETSAAHRLRILLVEDEEDTLTAMRQLLHLWGHEVHAVGDGPAALSLAAELRPEVVLLDIGLPGMDGWEVARLLRQQQETCEAVLIAVTGYGRDVDRDQSHRHGFVNHLVKPLDLEELKRCLDQVRRDH